LASEKKLRTVGVVPTNGIPAAAVLAADFQ
jgi:hypothetical protein